ncbi:MAG: VOC family protein [Geodermatophilaceae bacterium]
MPMEVLSMFTEAFPIVSTADMTRSLEFYVGLLEASVTYQFPADGDPGYVGLSLGGASLGIGLDPTAPTGRGGQRLSLWVYADDCDAAIERLREAGMQIVEEPVTQPWGERVARVLDPDGNEIVVGQRAGS